jgi:CarD family transcriptional regulator
MIKFNGIFYLGQSVVYPSHGVGTINSEERSTFAGIELSVYVVSFKQMSMELKIPKHLAIKNGLRPLTDSNLFEKAMDILSGKKIALDNSMWSKRVKTYMGKLNSGDVIAISTVLKELYPNLGNPDRSFSEKTIFNDALGRLSSEYALTHNIKDKDAREHISNKLSSFC